MTTFVRQFSGYIRLFLVLFSLSFFAIASSKAQGTVAGYDLLGTCGTHNYYISKTFYTGNTISTAVLDFQSKVASIPIAANRVYAAAILNGAENTCIQNLMLAYNTTKYGGNGKSNLSQWNDTRNPWIGLTDAAVEGTFVWSNGQPNCENYRNWNAGEPNNFGGTVSNGEDFVQMLIMNSVPGNDPLGKWNDFYNRYGENDPTHPEVKLPVIIEVGLADCPCTLTVSVSLPALSCDGPNVIYLGYGAQSVTATSNQAGTIFKWYMVGNPVAVSTGATFSPTTSGTYYVVATNNGCTASTAGTPSQIKVIDVRCYNPGKDAPHKIYVCHKKNGTHGNGTIGDNAHTLCVDADAVPAHLAHGDCLGQCPGDANSRLAGSNDISSETISFNKNSLKGFAVSGYPNPSRAGFSIQLEGSSTERVSIKITDITGRIVEQRSNLSPGKALKICENYRVGIYYIEVTQGMNKQQLKLVKQ